MNEKTEWFTSKHKPVRPGVYECIIEVLDCDFTVLVGWHPYRGWNIKSPRIKKWRGLTVHGYINRSGSKCTI